jgi:hypothetical protein
MSSKERTLLHWPMYVLQLTMFASVGKGPSCTLQTHTSLGVQHDLAIILSMGATVLAQDQCTYPLPQKQDSPISSRLASQAYEG